MILNENLHGFKVTRISTARDACAKVYGMVHEKTGAELVWFERDDENMTFAISFRTPPEDDTGIFHIIEHSVLCGSEKYPLKDPFAELLKSSLNTFLNALTYEDRTVYPVSSRCEKDFLNLVDIYLDAVFSPMLLNNPNIFRQEGWHYEYDEESDKLSYNGVVYNEMKGAYSSPDDVGCALMSKLLFEGTSYAYDSGGDPEHIPSLTYEKVKATHEKYYHPSNSKIVLDGKINLDTVLPLISSVLSRYEKKEIDSALSKSKPRISESQTVYYEAPAEGIEERARILFGSVYSDFSDKEAALTSLVLSDLLCGTNASPLKKALLDENLCKDALIYSSRAYEQTVITEIRDVKAENFDRIKDLAEKVIRRLASDGIDKKQLTSILNAIEFKLRENDHGSLPEGIGNALAAFANWNYGDLPEKGLLSFDAIRSLREKVDSDYFEKELLKMTVDNPHRATVIMLPDAEYGKKTANKLSRRLDEIRASMTQEELSRVIVEGDRLAEWQQAEEDEEAIRSLPTLSLSDIPSKINKTVTEETELLGAKILNHKIKTNGIVYISLHFDASDLTSEELYALSVLSAAYINFPTAIRDVLTLQNDVKAKLGSFVTSCTVGSRDGVATPYLKVGASFIESNFEDFLEIMSDVLLCSRFLDEKELLTITSQIISQTEDAIIASGESTALARIEASISEAGAITEHLVGYEHYKRLKEIIAQGEIKKLLAKLFELAKRVITRDRLTVSIAGEADNAYILKLIEAFPEGKKGKRNKISPIAEKSEYFITPSKVSYAAMGGYFDKIVKNLGFMRAAHTILSYEYLWNTVRVKNGAYGTGFIARRDGGIAFYSYRDPSPAASLGYYRESVAYLRALAASDESLTKFIIGTVGEYDMLTTPRMKANIAASHYLNGWSYDKEQAARDQLLSMKPSDLNICADIIEAALADASVAIVGNREHIASLPKKPKRIIEI